MYVSFKLFFIFSLIPYAMSEIHTSFVPSSRLVGFVLDKISPIGMKMCVKECAKRVSCASLNFHRSRLECELSHSDVTTNPENMTSDSEYIYISRNQIPQTYFDAGSASCSTNSRCVNTATGPKCVKSECPVSHPDATFTSVKVTSTRIGTTLSYTCNSITPINLTSTCKADGTWTSSPSSCVEYNPPDCFETIASCWYQFNFTFDTSFNGCNGGTRYIRKTQYPSTPYVGVILCNATRYKIMLGANVLDQFLNIGDAFGFGEDHCELVGGYQLGFMNANDSNHAPVVRGFWRNDWGEQFKIGMIGHTTDHSYNSWYECGVAIPGTQEPDCMTATPPCWYAYNAWLDNSMNGCSGGQILVKRTNYNSAPFLAAQLCTNTSYKLFLGASLGSKFMNIAERNGSGENQCELVGGSESTENFSCVASVEYTRVTTYFRNHVNEQFEYGYTNYSFAIPVIIHCGVSIPGSNVIV